VSLQRGDAESAEKSAENTLGDEEGRRERGVRFDAQKAESAEEEPALVR
jgi:hypothetical protein